MEQRRLGTTEIFVSTIALGCWPIAGVTTLDTNEADSLATVAACLDLGINFLDTAYCYGRNGESETLIRRALGNRRDEMVIASKGGIHYGPDGKQARDASPATLKRECDESLARLGTDRVELLYLHAPDPNIAIEESAGAFRELLDAGKTRSVGVSNVTLAEMQAFQKVCPIAAYQPHYNMLQREIEQDTLPWCTEQGISAMVYWPLLKGLLAGKLPRDHVFNPADGRVKYPMFQGEEWQKNQDLVDKLRTIAADAGKTVAQLAINWTIAQPGITVALCGAKRPDQIRENAGGADWTLTSEQRARVEQALHERGVPATRAAV